MLRFLASFIASETTICPRPSPSSFLKKSASREVEKILRMLDDEERELIALRYEADMPIKDIAKLFGISPNAATHRFRRILEKCRNFEEKAGNELSDFL